MRVRSVANLAGFDSTKERQDEARRRDSLLIACLILTLVTPSYRNGCGTSGLSRSNRLLVRCYRDTALSGAGGPK